MHLYTDNWLSHSMFSQMFSSCCGLMHLRVRWRSPVTNWVSAFRMPSSLLYFTAPSTTMTENLTSSQHMMIGFLQSNHVTGSRPNLRQSKFQNSFQAFSANTDSNIRVNITTSTTSCLCLLQEAPYQSPRPSDCHASWQRNLILYSPCL